MKKKRKKKEKLGKSSNMCLLVNLAGERHRWKLGRQAGVCEVWQRGKTGLGSQPSRLGVG